jgi:hypothetical protein
MSESEEKSLKGWIIKMTIFYLVVLFLSGAVWYATSNATNVQQTKDIELLKTTKVDKDNLMPVVERNQAEIEKLRIDKADKETVAAQLDGITQQLKYITKLLEK